MKIGLKQFHNSKTEMTSPIRERLHIIASLKPGDTISPRLNRRIRHRSWIGSIARKYYQENRHDTYEWISETFQMALVKMNLLSRRSVNYSYLRAIQSARRGIDCLIPTYSRDNTMVNLLLELSKNLSISLGRYQPPDSAMALPCRRLDLDPCPSFHDLNSLSISS